MSGLPIPVVQYRHCVFVYKSYLFSLCDASTDSFVDKSTQCWGTVYVTRRQYHVGLSGVHIYVDALCQLK